jgi:hypothetical protein
MLNIDSFSHNVFDTIDCVLVHWLVLVRGLIYCQFVQNVFIVAFVNEKFILILFDNDIPRVEGFGGGHDRGNGDLCREDICFFLLCETADDGVFQSRDVVENWAIVLFKRDLLVSSALVYLLVVLKDLTALQAGVK